jgi:cell division protein FtsA
VSNTILAIDIGSTKISAVIANVNHKVQILGHGVSASQGIKKGTISNIELASKSIKSAVSDAKRVSGTNVSNAIVTISNAYAKSISSSGIVNLPNNEITIKEINRVMQTALYNAKIPDEYEVIHVLPYNFTVDEQEFVEDPFGMNATRLEVNVNIILTQKSSLSNLKKAVRSAGIEIDSIVLSGYASAISSITDEEKNLGAAIIDMGGQTCNLVIHVGNSIRYNDFLGVGSNHITNDLSMALHTPLQVAESIKINYVNMLEISNETIEVPIIGDEDNTKEVSLEMVYNVVFARVEEALMILAKSIANGIVREDQKLTDKEIYNLIFAAGVSTAKVVSDISGRGVGMDVVRRNIEDLRGTVSIKSKLGFGTTMTIRLPLTLAIIDGFLVQVGDKKYIIPLDMIQECIELTKIQRARMQGNNYITLRKEILPLLDVREYFDEKPNQKKRENIVVVKYGSSQIGLQVDELYGEFQTVIKPLGELFENIRGISGGTILGTGEIALIFDIPKLIEYKIMHMENK